MTEIHDILVNQSRPEAEKRFIESTRSQYLGGGIVLCKILGDKTFFVPGDDFGLSPHLIFEGFWEFWLTKYFALSIKPGDVVIDIGANLGYYTILAADLVTDAGKVLAVEPNPYIYSLLTKNVGINGYWHRVEALNFALSDTSDKKRLPFFVPTGEPKNGRIIDDNANIEQLGKLGTVLDVPIGALEADRFDRVDFIKIDVEGAELAVLTHLRPIIERFSPRIVCEVNFSRGYSYDDVQAALGTAEDLLHLDFNASVGPLSREMSKNERVGEDWLVCLN